MMPAMSMGAYDEDEHERREKKNNTVDANFNAQRPDYRGDVEYEGDDSTEELLDQFKELQSE